MLNQVLIIALVAVVGIPALAQQKINPSLPNPRVKENYDRFSDMTSVTLPLRLINNGPRILELAISGVVEGRDTTKSKPRVVLIVTSFSDEWVYLKSPNVIQIILDDKTRATLGEAKRVNSEIQSRGRGVIEQLNLEVPATVILKLSEAKRLEMKIGPDEVEFTTSQIADLRDWVEKFPAITTAQDTTSN